MDPTAIIPTKVGTFSGAKVSKKIEYAIKRMKKVSNWLNKKI
jgi:hypothetical protein